MRELYISRLAELPAIKVWLDDERQAPDGWLWFHTARTCIAALDMLRASGMIVDTISFDHDLGEEPAGNGYQVLLWIEEQVFMNGYEPPKTMKVHSANAGARGKMLQAITAIQLRWNK